MAKKKAEEAAGGGGGEKKGEDDFDPNADITKMSLPEQLQWNKKKMEWNAK